MADHDLLRLSNQLVAEAQADAGAVARGAGPLFQQSSAQRIDDLIRVLKFHEHRYYVLDDPLVTDREYDALYRQLLRLEEAHTRLVRSDSPSQRVGSDLTTNFSTVAHLVPMLSLANSYDLEDLRDWAASVRRYLKVEPDAPLTFAVEPKYDGGSVALVYEGDMLVRGATRGNGAEGEEITNNLRTLPSVPLKAAFSSLGMQRVELRGEALIRKDRFAALNAERTELNRVAREARGADAPQQSLFANPRNAATGALRMKDPRETAARKLDAFVYSLGYGVDAAGQDRVLALGSHFAAVEALGRLGFLIPGEYMRRCETIEAVASFCESMQAQRDELPYELDGMVVKVDDLALQARLGNTSHHPRWAIAFKFAAQQATSTLEQVDFQVGKIGSVTPVARITPVALAGVTVSNVSLHNEDFIRDKDIRLGDKILVERAGDVIPYIVKSLPEYRDGTQAEVRWPERCPECAEPIVRPVGEARWLCINNDCPAQVIARLIHHVSKDAMDIDGLGEKQLVRFRENGFITGLPDIYRLPYERISALEGFKERSIEKLKAAIETAKGNPIQRFLYSLSIHHVGRTASKMLAEQVTDVRELAEWPPERYLALHGMGQTVADNMMAWWALEHNRRMMDELATLGVNMRQTEEDKPMVPNADGPFAGKTILFTGTLTTIGRKEAQGLAEAAGARNVSGISAKLDILVAGEKAGSKLKKAEALGTVAVMTEEEFLARVRT